MSHRLPIAVLLLAWTLVACDREVPRSNSATVSSKPMVERFECRRCHVIDGVGAPHPRLDCTGCHQAIFTDHFANYDDATVESWRKHVRHFRLTPSLRGVKRFRRGWLERFLLEPHDIRPGLEEQMPRLPISREEAGRLADELGVSADDEDRAVSGDAARGRDLYASLGCADCHSFSGSDAPPGPTFDGRAAPATQRRAPDLRHARDRMSSKSLRRWLAGPREVKPDALMTQVISDPRQREDIAAYILETPLKPQPKPRLPEIPAPVDREVRWDDVNRAIFHVTCRHCHTDGGPALPGEGGAGNTGGFGYSGAGLVLSSYEGVKRGAVADDGTRRDILARDESGVAPIVRHLIARHHELAGAPREGTLGMPLGLPAVTLENIALLRAWIAQGAPN